MHSIQEKDTEMSSSLLGVLEQFKILEASSTVMIPFILEEASLEIFGFFAASNMV